MHLVAEIIFIFLIVYLTGSSSVLLVRFFYFIEGSEGTSYEIKGTACRSCAIFLSIDILIEKSNILTK